MDILPMLSLLVTGICFLVVITWISEIIAAVFITIIAFTTYCAGHCRVNFVQIMIEKWGNLEPVLHFGILSLVALFLVYFFGYLIKNYKLIMIRKDRYSCLLNCL